MTRAVVTGGAGFIGSHVVERLLARGDEVIVLDNFSSGKVENLARVKRNGKLRIVRGSILNQALVAKTLKNVDIVIHEAGIVSVTKSVSQPITVFRENVEGTLRLLEESRRASVRSFVFASSCGVYGNAKILPTNEEALIAPISPYAASKAAAEQFCTAYYRTYGLGTICLRYTNVYGPRKATGLYGGVVTKFAERLFSHFPPTIFGDGKQKRDFVYSSDVADATVRASNCASARGSIINIGSGIGISINALAQLMSELTNNRHIGSVRCKPRVGDVSNSCADTRRARDLLNFKCRVPLRDGLAKFLSWYKETIRQNKTQ